MFQGTSLLALDQKGRLMLPTRHKADVLQVCRGQLTLTRHPDGCLVIYPRDSWMEKRAALLALPNTARQLVRLVLGSAVDVELDKAGRLLVPPELRSAAMLDKDVALVGLGEHFELWDRDTWLAKMSAPLTVDMDTISFTF